MRLPKLILAAALLLPTIAVAADALTGNELLKLCEDPSAGQAGGIACGMYVYGYLQALDDQQKHGNPICLPDGLTGEQGYAVIRKFMSDHPEDLRSPAHALVAVALALAFPCKKSN